MLYLCSTKVRGKRPTFWTMIGIVPTIKRKGAKP
uniref:Uncharacterized protein n=1 Tax=Siphoviridae sp. ctoic9 TaxID=2825671 RepID=A0A8S5QAS7_9CAUD|nr:MAG TPA: hypothetical protein [Siphoviridae sp. ctoic9]